MSAPAGMAPHQQRMLERLRGGFADLDDAPRLLKSGLVCHEHA
jgi:hypothetical protein